jgi:hypothetical protein
MLGIIFAKRKDFLLPICLMISLTVVKLITFPNFWLDAVILVLIAQKLWRCTVYNDNIIIDNLTIGIFIFSVFLIFNVFIHFDPRAAQECRQILTYLILYPLFLNITTYERFEFKYIVKGLMVCAVVIFISFIVFYINPLAYATIAHAYGLTELKDVIQENHTFRFFSVFRGPLYCGQAMMTMCLLFYCTKKRLLSLIFYIFLLSTQTRAPIILTTLTFSIIGLINIISLVHHHRIVHLKRLLISGILISSILFISTLFIAYNNDQLYKKLNLKRFTEDIVSFKFIKQRSPAPKHFWMFFDAHFDSIVGHGLANGVITDYSVNDGNFYKVLHELGIIGFILYSFLFLFIFYRFLKSDDLILKTIYLIAFLMFLVGFTTTIITSYYSFHILFMSAGIIESRKIKKRFFVTNRGIIQGLINPIPTVLNDQNMPVCQFTAQQ